MTSVLASIPIWLSLPRTSCAFRNEMHRMTEVSAAAWMHGAPQSGLAMLILRMSLRTSVETAGRPSW